MQRLSIKPGFTEETAIITKSDAQRTTTTLMSDVEMCMGMGFPMGMGIPWESHGNGNETEMEMGIKGNGNYLRSHGNAFPWEYITYSRKRTSIDVLHN